MSRETGVHDVGKTVPMTDGDRHEQGGPAAPGAAPEEPSPRRGPAGLIVRDPDRGVIGGVCQGIADRSGIDPLLIRMLAALAGLSAGIGIAVYVVLWLMTPARRSPDGPVEQPLPLLSRTGWPGFTVMLLAIGAGTVLATRGIAPLAWWPITFVALVIIVMGILGPPMARARQRGRRPEPSRSTRPATVVTMIALPLAAAAGAATFLTVDARPLTRMVWAIAAALATIAVALILSSRWGLSRPLRDAGACLAVIILVLDTPFITTLDFQDRPTEREPTGQAGHPVEQVTIENRNTSLDLGSLVAHNGEMTIQVRDATVSLVVPDDRNVTIDYSCFFSELALPPEGGCTGLGTGTWTSTVGAAQPDPEGHTVPQEALHVQVRLVRSQMEVLR